MQCTWETIPGTCVEAVMVIYAHTKVDSYYILNTNQCANYLFETSTMLQNVHGQSSL